MNNNRKHIRFYIVSFVLLLFSTTWAYQAKQSAIKKPAPIPSRWKGVIGKYESGTNSFLVLEKGNRVFNRKFYGHETGKIVEMTGGFDEFSQRSYSNSLFPLPTSRFNHGDINVFSLRLSSANSAISALK